MIDLIKVYGFLSDKDIDYLNNLCNNFVADFIQIYNTQTIKTDELLDFKNKISNYVKQTFGDRYELQPMWINKVTNNDENADTFHYDNSHLTIITYFNTNFEGGNFEYISQNNTKVTINPEINLSLIMDDKLWHRITKVKKGNRYSLVSFFKLTTKNDKKQTTLL